MPSGEMRPLSGWARNVAVHTVGEQDAPLGCRSFSAARVLSSTTVSPLFAEVTVSRTGTVMDPALSAAAAPRPPVSADTIQIAGMTRKNTTMTVGSAEAVLVPRE